MNIPSLQPGSSFGLPIEGPKTNKPAPSAASARKDRLELSKDSEKRDSTTAGIAAVATAREPVREEKVTEARRKLDAGYYDTPDVLDQTAKRLLANRLV